MNHRYPNPALLFTPIVALTVACGDDGSGTTSSESSSGGGEASSESGGDPTGDSTTDTPTTTNQTTDTSTGPQTTDTSTGPQTTDTSTGPETTDTSTTDATTSTTDATTGTTTDGTTGGVVELTSVWATSNVMGFEPDRIVGLTPALDAQFTAQQVLGELISIQSVGINPGGDAIISFDAPGGVGGVIIDVNLADNPMNGALGIGDRLILGPQTGLVSPKGVEAVGPGTTFLVADTGAMAIKAFELADFGDVAPAFEVTDLGSSTAVWDMHYIGGNTDTLYAAGTNGEVQVYEDFSNDMGASGPTRTIVPAQNNNKVSVNLHGITVDGDTLYLTDVGDPNNATDGQIFRITNASALDGMETVTQRITGANLGNPVDIELRAGGTPRVYVAEKANSALNTYTIDVITQNLMASNTFAVPSPESVALSTGTRLIVARNQMGLDMDAVLAINAPLIGNPTITATINPLGSIISLESIVLNAGGVGIVSFDGPAVSNGGGALAVPGLSDLMGDGTVDGVGIRIWGGMTDIETPKGIALNAAGDRLFVADTAAGDIKVFDATAPGDVAAVLTFADIGGGMVWDVAYDDANDRLFAAGTDGVVRVFDAALANGDPPSRVITPAAMGMKISTNLHGIAYDAASDTLLVSDVGSVMANDDGRIYTIAMASSADDLVDVKAAIGGDQTQLGNPVDIAFDGVNLYVAEKANGVVLRYDGVLGLDGPVNAAADASIDVPAAESVALYFSAP